MSFQHLSVKPKDVQPGRVVTVWNDHDGVAQISPQKRTIHKPVTLIVSEVSKRGSVLMVTGSRAKDDGTPRKKAVEATLLLSGADVLVQWNNTEAEAPAA